MFGIKNNNDPSQIDSNCHATIPVREQAKESPLNARLQTLARDWGVFASLSRLLRNVSTAPAKISSPVISGIIFVMSSIQTPQ